jgi:hypothetical protein
MLLHKTRVIQFMEEDIQKPLDKIDYYKSINKCIICGNEGLYKDNALCYICYSKTLDSRGIIIYRGITDSSIDDEDKDYNQ